MPPRRHRRTTSAVSESEIPQEGGRNVRSSSQQSNKNNTNNNFLQPSQSFERNSTVRGSSNANAASSAFQQQPKHHEIIDMTAQTDARQMIFDLYPQHTTTTNQQRYEEDMMMQQQQQQEPVERKVFYQQPDGRFTDAQGEEANRRQRIAAHHQLEELRTRVPTWMDVDDAKLFAPFFLYVVFAITHIRRMMAGAAAGFSILILIAIYWAPSLTGVSIDSRTNIVLENATIGGAYGVLCLNETFAEGSASTSDDPTSNMCSSVVAYSAIYRPASYFFLIVSLLCTFGSLVPFVFDLALMNIRSPPTEAEIRDQQQKQQQLQIQRMMESSQQQQQQGGEGNNTTNNKENYSSLDQSGGIGNMNVSNTNNNNEQNKNKNGIAQTTGSSLPAAFGANPRMMQNQAPALAYTNMCVRHLVISTFPLFFIALITCMVTQAIEVDRRESGQMVEVTLSQADTIRSSLIVRSVCYILAWVVSFRFRERVATDEVLNAAAVIDLRS